MTALTTKPKKPAGVPSLKHGEGAYSLVHRESTHTNPNTGPSHHFDVLHTGQEKPVGTATIHADSTGSYGGMHVNLTHPDHMKDSLAAKVGNHLKEHIFPKEAKGDVIDVEATPVKKSLERLDDLIKAVEVLSKKPKKEEPKDKAEKAIKPGAPLDYSAMNKPKAKPPEASAPTIDYSAAGGVKRTPGAPSVEDGFKVPKEKQTPLKSPKFHTKLREQRVAAGVVKCQPELDELLSKADKDELFPDYNDMKIAPSKVEWTPDKESAANSVFYCVQRLAEIKNQSYAAHDKGDDVKKAFEYLYEKEKENLKEKVACYKKAKERPMAKSEDMGKITPEALTKSILEKHSTESITAMLKTAVDSGRLHHNVFVEWTNYKTLNPHIIGLIDGE